MGIGFADPRIYPETRFRKMLRPPVDPKDMEPTDIQSVVQLVAEAYSWLSPADEEAIMSAFDTWRRDKGYPTITGEEKFAFFRTYLGDPKGLKQQFLDKLANDTILFPTQVLVSP